MIKVAEWGTGMMGQGLLGFILDRPKDIDLVGVIVTNPAKEGKTVGELLGRPCDVKMTTDFEAVLAKKPDVVCINTQSNLDEVEPQILPALKAGCNVICIAEKISLSVGQRSRARRPVRPRRQGERRQHPRHRHQPRLRARRPHRHVELDLPARRQHRGLARQRPLAVRPDRDGRPGRRHHRRAVREGRRRRQHRRPHRLPRVHRAHRQGAELEDRRDRRDPRAHRHRGRALDAARARPGRLGRGLQAGRQGLQQRRAQDPPHPPAADPPRDGRTRAPATTSRSSATPT